MDVGLPGAKVRVVSTHLEIAEFAPIQVAQTVELLCAATKTHLPVILVGDLNSSADRGGPNDTLSYEILRLAGFRDAWSRTNPGEPGYTCCQEADLRNETSTLDDRIDFVLTRGRVVPKTTDILGESEADRTDSGLWLSDHAGVVADLQLRAWRPWFCHVASSSIFAASPAIDAGGRTGGEDTANVLRRGRALGPAEQDSLTRRRDRQSARGGFIHGSDVAESIEFAVPLEDSLLDLLSVDIISAS